MRIGLVSLAARALILRLVFHRGRPVDSSIITVHHEYESRAPLPVKRDPVAKYQLFSEITGREEIISIGVPDRTLRKCIGSSNSRHPTSPESIPVDEIDSICGMGEKTSIRNGKRMVFLYSS